MKIAVVGAGIVGVCTAYELAVDGHQVTVLERRGSVAAEGSFAHAGVAAATQATPWGWPAGSGRTVRDGHLRRASIRLRVTQTAPALAWLWQAWRSGAAPVYGANLERLQALAQRSAQRREQLQRSLALHYESSRGQLLLMRDARDAARFQPGLDALAQLGNRLEWLDAAGCRAVEPALETGAGLHAGILLRDAEVGNCRQFTHLLRYEAQRLGVRFRFHVDVLAVRPGREPELRVLHAPPEESRLMGAPDAPPDAQDTQPMAPEPRVNAFDAVVICAGAAGARLLRPCGLKLPVLDVQGYTVTAPLRHHDGHGDAGPRSAVTDLRHRVTISRIGDRVRVSGGDEIGGSRREHDPRIVASLYKVLDDWFPGAARTSQAHRWKGGRAMMPDGAPLIGRSGLDGVWLNLAHGASGWTLACGAARLVADGLAGTPVPAALGGLGIERWKELP